MNIDRITAVASDTLRLDHTGGDTAAAAAAHWQQTPPSAATAKTEATAATPSQQQSNSTTQQPNQCSLHDEHHTASIIDSLCASVGQLGRSGILAPLLANLHAANLAEAETQLAASSPPMPQLRAAAIGAALLRRITWRYLAKRGARGSTLPATPSSRRWPRP